MTPRTLVALVLGVLPLAVQASPFVYVASSGANPGAVTVIDLDGDVVKTSLMQSNTYPRAVAVTPDGTSLFVTTDKGSIERYNVNESMHLWNAWLDLGGNNAPRGMAVSSDGSRVYVAMAATNAFAVVENTVPMRFTLVPLATSGGLFAEIDPDDEWLYIVHADGSLSVVDLTTLDLAAGTVSVTTRAGAAPSPGGTSMLGSWLVVSDGMRNRLRTFFSPTLPNSQDLRLPDVPRGVVAYMDGQSARYLTVFELGDDLYAMPGAVARPTGGQAPYDVAWSAAQQVAVVSNSGSDSVSVMRASPAVITDPSLSQPTDLTVGPRLLPMPEPRHTDLSFVYKLCGDTVTTTQTITNRGPGWLDVGKVVKLAGASVAAYSVREDTCTGRRIAPLRSCAVTYRLVVRADLGVKGAFNATATMTSNAGDLVAALATKPAGKPCQ